MLSAGPAQSLSLPLEFVPLDGSKSHDDGHITSFLWTVDSQPNKAKLPEFSNASASVTNVTNITVGKYVFRLTVVDNSGNKDSATMVLEVQHDTNLPPVAQPGQDHSVLLPHNSVVLDGRGSTDDLGVERMSWSRGPGSPAAGWVVGGDTSVAVITVAGLVQGTYTFTLTVWDKSDEKDSKDVKVTVKPDPDVLSEVEIILNKDLSHMTEKDVGIRVASK